MDIVSEPAFTEETVRDLDIAFLNGIRSLTLGPNDTFALDESQMDVVWNGEQVTLFTQHILWFSLRTRVIKRPVPKSPIVPVDHHAFLQDQ